MIKIILTFVIYLITNVIYSQSNEITSDVNQSITVTVPKTSSNKGKVYFSIYNEESFLVKAIKEESTEITNQVATVTFKSIPKGNYAIVCYHDSNSNNKLDFNENRIPLEDYGSTNNVFNYGPPNFKDAKFEVKDKDLNFEIRF